MLLLFDVFNDFFGKVERPFIVVYIILGKGHFIKFTFLSSSFIFSIFSKNKKN